MCMGNSGASRRVAQISGGRAHRGVGMQRLGAGSAGIGENVRHLQHAVLEAVEGVTFVPRVHKVGRHARWHAHYP